MTGRDLIVYILKNGLEDEPVFKDGKFIGFKTPAEVAVNMNVGLATISAWIAEDRLPGIRVEGGLYIPANHKSPFEKLKY